MKRLVITGWDGVCITDILVNVIGEDFNLQFTTPIFFPVINISLTDPPEEEEEK